MRFARLALMLSGGVLLVLGVYIWTGNGDWVIPAHIAVGAILVITVWAIATTAALAGVSRPLIAMAVAWSVLVLLFGVTQGRILEGGAHWVIQVVHLAISIALVGWGQLLIVATKRETSAKGG